MTALFPPEAFAALQVDGIAERWAAVQAQLHPHLSHLAQQVATAAARRFPRQWPLYELSYKSQRALNRGRGRRAPIEDYWVAFDRPPRGAGIMLTVSGNEQAILVGLQCWRVRKPDLATLWGSAPAIWRPLVERIERDGQVRFSARTEHDQGADVFWIERYLAERNAGYLWAGFVYDWANLPDDLEQRLIDHVLELFPLNEALMEQAETYAPDARSLREPSPLYAAGLPPLDTLTARVRDRGLTIDDLTLRSYHLALQTRPLVILAGISGTGKTRLTRLYADAVYAIPPGRTNPYYLVVPVQPDWHSARDLLGYYNALTEVFHATPFLQFLLRAAADPQAIYYVCLDELNLARPEYYLAPILSAMETLDAVIELGAPPGEVVLAGGGSLREPFRLPLNVRLIGTVNVDESSFGLSDKLLDRANLIELTDVDLEGFRQSYPGVVADSTWALIVQIHALTVEAGHPFGYRTLGEILRFLDQAGSTGALTPEQALDLQIKQKVLPRLRGEEGPRLRRALTGMLALMLGGDPLPERAARISPARLAAAPYPASAAKLRTMLDRLDLDGFTDFY
jgi:hypothetical protein